MMTTETSFFRDGCPFDTLRDHILPALIERNRALRRLRIWSAACATGQEAYSLAMLLREHFPELSAWDVRILGTDLSDHCVQYARTGRYRRLEVNRGLPARMLLRYMSRHGEEWEVAPAIRALCEVHQMNLCTPAAGLPRFDLILLRNVLLYFPPDERTCVLRNVHRQLHPEGFLLLGSAEQAEDSTNLFEAQFARNCYFYQPSPLQQQDAPAHPHATASILPYAGTPVSCRVYEGVQCRERLSGRAPDPDEPNPSPGPARRPSPVIPSRSFIP